MALLSVAPNDILTPQQELPKELQRRVMLYEAANRDAALRAFLREKCRRDPVFFLNHFGWTYDPRPAQDLPFVLWSRQVDLVRWMLGRVHAKKRGLLEKSRDQGATWASCGLGVWLFLFGHRMQVDYLTYKEDMIDRPGKMDTMFEKLRYLLSRTPWWLLPEGYGRHCENYTRIVNPANGSSLIGISGQEPGRGGRASVLFVDEHAAYQNADEVERAISHVASCRIYMSTPRGMGNLFARMRFGGNIDVFTMHWMDDPRKNHYVILSADGKQLGGGNGRVESVPQGSRVIYPWYEQQVEEADGDDVKVAQEVDIDYSASVEGILIPAKKVQACVDLHKRFSIPISSFGVAGCDVADGGKDANAFVARFGPIVGRVESWHGEDPGATFLEMAREEGVKALHYDAPGAGAAVGSTLRRQRGLPFAARGINTGVPASDARWPDGRTSKERFGNLKAELWWILKRRVEKTYRFVTEGVECDPSEMISLPNDQELLNEISSVIAHQDERGRVIIERKEEMRKRGVKSPNKADALVLTFVPILANGGAAVGGTREINKFVPR